MKKNLFNRLVAKMFGKSNTTSRAPKSRKLVLESLERRNLLAVGSPAVVESVERVAPATAFYAAENVNIDAAPALAVDLSAVANIERASEDVIDEFGRTSLDALVEWIDENGSEAEIETDNDSEREDAGNEEATVLTLIQYLNSESIKDYALGYARDVFFYSSVDPECDLEALNFDDESILFIDLGAYEEQESVMLTAFATLITRSGGGDEPDEPEVEPISAGEISSDSSPFISEKNDGTSNAPSDATYFTIHIPEVPAGYEAWLEFIEDTTNSTSGAVFGTDYGIVQAGLANGEYYPIAPVYPHPIIGPNDDRLEVSGGFDYCIVPFNDGYLEDPESFIVQFYIKAASGGAAPIYGNALNATILDANRTVNVSWDNGNYNGQGATLSYNPNGGGARVYPEQEDDSYSSLKNVVSLNFHLEEPAPASGLRVYYKLLDPDNYISVGNNQSSSTLNGASHYAGNDNHLNAPKRIDINSHVESDIIVENLYYIDFSEDETDKSIQVRIPTAYAGDNWIVFAGTSAAQVSASALGTDEFDRYSITRTETNLQVAQSPMLTVWRSLWLEFDQLVSLSQGEAGVLGTGAILDAAFEEACVKVKSFPDYLNENPTIEDEEHDLAEMYLLEENGVIRPYYETTPDEYAPFPLDEFLDTRDIPTSTNNYWSVRVISAFIDKNNESEVGITFPSNNQILRGTIMVFIDSCYKQVYNYNYYHSNQTVDLYRYELRVICHEIGHLFSLGHSITNSIMNPVAYPSYVSDLNSQWLSFTVDDLAIIQSKNFPV